MEPGPGGQRGQVRGADAETPNVVVAKPPAHFRMRLSSMQLVQKLVIRRNALYSTLTILLLNTASPASPTFVVAKFPLLTTKPFRPPTFYTHIAMSVANGTHPTVDDDLDSSCKPGYSLSEPLADTLFNP